jgi:predicted negative regulator of RcsB-dependent stress response
MIEGFLALVAAVFGALFAWKNHQQKKTSQERDAYRDAHDSITSAAQRIREVRKEIAAKAPVKARKHFESQP